MKNLLIVIFGLIISTTTSIFVMIKGWGVEPQSWLWILVVYPLGTFVGIIIAQLGNTKES